MSRLNATKYEPFVVGFHGLPGSGKDTLANKLRSCGFKHASFAAPLKKCMSTLFDFPVLFYENRDLKEEPLHGYDELTPRIVAQRGGDALKAAFGEDFLLNITKNKITNYLKAGDSVIITDVRFENEAQMIKNLENGIIIKLDAGDRINSLGSGASHKSNIPLSEKYIDYTISTNCDVTESEKELIKTLGL